MFLKLHPANTVMPLPAPERYSTNPHTIRARLRKMSLTGAQKVEEAGKTADYKALRHARKVLEADPEYLAASGTARGAMLKRRMRDTMEKRYAPIEPTTFVTCFHGLNIPDA